MNLRKFISFLVLILILNVCLYSQNNTKRPNQYFSSETFEEMDVLSKYYKKALSEKGSKSALSGFTASGIENSGLLDKTSALVPLDGFIDPKDYYVGPSDILEVNIWGALPLTLPVIISPEGNAIINAVGEVPLKNLSLLEAKNTITSEIKKKFKSSYVTVTLRSPRLFSVSVIGNVNNPGNFVVSAIDRVDRVVTLAVKQLDMNQNLNKTDMEKLSYFRDTEEKERNDYSLRNIKIFRRNGDTLKIDLVKYFSIGDISGNPYLRDGDIVFVPKEDLDGNVISVFGAVKQQGVFEYSKGDNLTTAFKIAQGANENSDLHNVELTRVNADWTNYTTTAINLKAILDGKEKDIDLLPGDRIFIRPIKVVNPTKEITIKGEILKPGKYPIIKGVTKLTDVIQNAGGFTENASLAEAKIVRKSLSQDELEKNPDYVRLETMRLGKLDKSDIEYFTIEEAIKRGYVAADFKKIFKDKDKSADIVLEGDEIIYIPTDNNSVYVYGQVNNPGYITISNSLELDDYIKKAGGYSDGALKGDVAVIKGGSKEWKDPDDTKIESGDVIWVPKKTYRDLLSWGEILRDVSQVIISAGTLALLIIQLRNN